MQLNEFKWSFVVSLTMLLGFQLDGGAPSIFWNWLSSDFDSQVDGKIISSDIYIGSLRTSDTYSVRYSYVVDGKFYSSSIVDGNSFSSRPEEVLHKYPAGREVVVFYDSNNPKYAVLEKGPLGWSVALQVAAIFGVLFWPVFSFAARLFRNWRMKFI